MKRGRKPRTEPDDRERAMAAAFKAGKTLVEIGAEYGLTRERVRQLIKRCGVVGKHGGAHKRAAARQIKRAARKDEATLQRWGCTWAQYCELRAMFKPTRAFSCQKKNAHHRGIPWELTLWQWWTIWQQSGRWDQRGRGNGYMMCRKGDAGPYSVDNVFIARGIVNSSEGQDKRRRHNLPMGVCLVKGKYFIAQRQLSGKKTYLGQFATPELAHAAYLAADPMRAAA